MRILKDSLSYIHNRWIYPSHKITIRDNEFGIGHYHDIDYVLLYSNFQLLVDYVEIDCAGSNNKHFNTKWQKFLDYIPLEEYWHYFIRPRRNALQGLHRLRWEMKMTDVPLQSESASAFFKLYKFWKHDRPNRIDPYDLIPDKMAENIFKRTTENNGVLTVIEHENKIYNQVQELKDKYYTEDEAMLTLLIKYRNCLWT